MPVVLKRRKTTGGLTVSRQPLVVRHQAGHADNRQVIPATEFCPQSDEDERGEHHDL